MSIVYLNGDYLESDKATISVFDRGFLFADGVYEVIPIYNGKAFCAKEHLQRLNNSLKLIEIPMPKTFANWQQIFADLIAKNSAEKGIYHFYLQITRGAPQARSHTYNKREINPTIFVSLNKSSKNLSLIELSRGKSAITAQDTRWENCNIKSIALLANILHSQQAKNSGAEETILIRNNNAMEGASSNIFIVKNNQLITPPISSFILAGVTRKIIIDLAKKNKINVIEKNITEKDLFSADEIWITSSTREIYPITTLNKQQIGNGKAGPLWQQMIKLYHDACYS